MSRLFSNRGSNSKAIDDLIKKESDQVRAFCKQLLADYFAHCIKWLPRASKLEEDGAFAVRTQAAWWQENQDYISHAENLKTSYLVSVVHPEFWKFPLDNGFFSPVQLQNLGHCYFIELRHTLNTLPPPIEVICISYKVPIL